MKYLIFHLILLLALISCNTDPRPIAFGRDTCQHCKMKLMDPKHGAEVVTEKGKIFILDDVNCLIDFLNSETMTAQQAKHILIVPLDKPETLTDATLAFYLKSPEFKTPMASNILAFSDYTALKDYKSKHGGLYLAWGELLTQFK
jgi:copper chaperone NosL